MTETGAARRADRSQIVAKLREILEPWVSDVGVLEAAGEKTNLVMDMGLDSVGILQMTLEVEREFGVALKSHEIDSQLLSMMGNLVSLIETKLHEADRPAEE